MKQPLRLLALSVLCSLASSVSAAPMIKRGENSEVTDVAESVIGPDYKNAPETQRKPRVPQGEIHEFTMDSKDSKIYKGIAKGKQGEQPYTRKVAVYVPKQYRSTKEAPFIVIQDGMGYRDVVSKVLDNMIAEKRLPVMIAVFVNSGGGDAQGSQRGLEYDTLDGKYTEFIESEVLPRISKDYDIKFTKDPEGRATMGGSSGGAAAFTMAWYHPELYRKVLTYSGTYVNQQSPFDKKTPTGAWEYHENLIRRSAKKPIRIWLEVSEKDNGWNKDEASLHNWVMANERMAKELKKKDYDYRYVFAKNAGHTDGKVTWQTLPGALEWLWQGYPMR